MCCLKSKVASGPGGPVKTLWSCGQRDGRRVDVCCVCVSEYVQVGISLWSGRWRESGCVQCVCVCV